MTAIRVLSNPVAYRVLTTIGMRGPQTTAELVAVLGDVPASSLYRQLARLREAGVLSVSGERQARGAVERTYALASRESGTVDPAALAALPIRQVRSTLRNFLALMMADVTAHIESRAFARNPAMTAAALIVCELTDDAYKNAITEIAGVFKRAKEASKGDAAAKPRYFYTIAIPEASAGSR